MPHKLTFYPVGNGDTVQVVIENGRRLLFDFCHRASGEESDNPLIDLKKALKDELRDAKRNSFDVVCFTHADDDHICGSTEFFELQHADKYQSGDRVKIGEMWVPASMILEEGCEGEDRVLRQEARYRLRQGTAIRVFSKPELLKTWMSEQGIDFDARKHLFVDAGTIVPTFSRGADGLEVFCHSPFVEHAHDGDKLRNDGSIILHLTFVAGETVTRFLEVGDTDHETLAQIVRVTAQHGRDERLEWDIYNVPHHCSYKALGPDKGEMMTESDDDVADLLRRGHNGSYVISSSQPIPDTADAYEQEQPPHIQAKNTYAAFLNEVRGRKLFVTMEYPVTRAPQPLRFTIGASGIHVEEYKDPAIGAAYIVRPQRAG